MDLINTKENFKNTFVSAEFIRNLFSSTMSEMYKIEVPLYGDLLQLVESVNKAFLLNKPELKNEFTKTGEIQRLNAERHGAIRLGKPSELFHMRRLFKVMGMFPVGYYDLASAGVPVHSTAFRAIDNSALNKAPFRVFTSLLRLDLIDSLELQQKVAAILENRQIFTEKVLHLIEKFEKHGGLTKDDSEIFVQEAIETFRWHKNATVSLEVYNELLAQHRLIADVVAFKGPHINHLTPRTLDIDCVQDKMKLKHILCKENIEGPPARKCPILLRQTSFKALSENVIFKNSSKILKEGEHKARFGEIEQRGIALTQKGQNLYDKLLAETRVAFGGSPNADNVEEYNMLLAENFKSFPDDYAVMQRDKLAYFYYHITEKRKEKYSVKKYIKTDINKLLEAGLLHITPIIYEDFLPISAAGIFTSNLGNDEIKQSYKETANQNLFEKYLGEPVLNLMKWYENKQEESIENCLLVLNS